MLIPYGLLLLLLGIATVVNLRTGLIPDGLTLPGSIGGILVSTIFPQALGGNSPLQGAGLAFLGAVAGFGIGYATVEVGKSLFGKKRIPFDEPRSVSWVRSGDEAVLTIGGDQLMWHDLFSRESDELLMDCPRLEIAGERFDDISACWSYERLHIGRRIWDLGKTDVVNAETTEITFPREAIGFGVVKLMMLVGAFLGWKAAIAIFCAALLLCFAAMAVIAVLNRGNSPGRVLFGPYVLISAILWIAWRLGWLFS